MDVTETDTLPALEAVLNGRWLGCLNLPDGQYAELWEYDGRWYLVADSEAAGFAFRVFPVCKWSE